MIYLDEPDLDYIPSTRGEDVRKFERAMSEYLGVGDCVAVNSGTSALHLALLACGIGRGDTVTVPVTTFVATANAVLYTGAKVKLVDIDPDTWCLQNRVYKKSVIAVPLYGTNVKIEFQVKKKKALVWDLSHSLHKDSNTSRFGGDFCIHSLNGNKIITTGGGGIVSGNRLDRIRCLINPGHARGIAYNYGMPALNARLGLKELPKLDDRLRKKSNFDAIYREELPFLKFQKVKKAGTNWKTAAIFPELVNVERLQIRLLGKGIQVGRVFRPLYLFPQHSQYLARFPNADYLYNHGLELPSSVKNEYEDIQRVCNKIKQLI